MNDDDDRLMQELSRAADVFDPVPGRLIDAGIAAFTFRTMEAELAQLVFDSADESAGQLVRSDRPSRVLSFETGSLTIELEVIRDGDSRHLVGQILPPRALQIDIRQQNGTTAVSSDDLGQFAAVLATAGPFQMSLPHASTAGRPTVTEWISG